ncbi:MAG: peptidoglycan editing factor PgeF [Gammaproteobacteria bacterium]
MINAQWPAPSNIRAITTTRMGGVSKADYATFNLAEHVGDNHEHVAANRQILSDILQLPSEPIWLEQTHSTRCVNVDKPQFERNADAALTRQQHKVLAIMTADCLPILICDRQGTEIAAIHAGWRGLANGIVDNTVNMLNSDLSQYIAWLGPAICGHCYATGAEVLDHFVSRYPYAAQAFTQIEDQWFADLARMATLILNDLGIGAVYPSQYCTFESNSQFYSYRRAAQTGRIATLIWFQE